MVWHWERGPQQYPSPPQEQVTAGGGGGALVGTGRAEQSRDRAEWASPQLGHFAGEISQQASTGRWLPSFGQTGLGHLWAALVWCRLQREHVG